MTSKRQIKANRANATRSTGPKTIDGKARSSRNAFRHGLSRWDNNDNFGTDALTRTLAAELTGTSAEVAAQDIARARYRLTDIRLIRFKLLLTMIEWPKPEHMKAVAGLARYENVAWTRTRRGLKRLNGGSRCCS